MNKFLRIFIGLSIVLLALSVTALSCNKVGGDKNNANNSGDGGGGGNGGGGGETPASSVCADNPTTHCLELKESTLLGNNYTKIVDKTNVVVNAAGLAAATGARPISDAEDTNRSFNDGASDTKIKYSFDVNYPGATETLTFVSLSKGANGKDITTNTLALEKAVDSSGKCTSATSDSESSDNAFATRPQGGHCVGYIPPNGVEVGFYSYLGTVFNNPNPTTHARGIMRCGGSFFSSTRIGGTAQTITDTSVSVDSQDQTCGIIVVNNAGTAATKLIDDNWVDATGSVKEVELYAVGIDIDGKSISQLLPAADNFTLAKFTGGIDNATFKKLLDNNKWKDLKFKVKIVKSADYTK